MGAVAPSDLRMPYISGRVKHPVSHTCCQSAQSDRPEPVERRIPRSKFAKNSLVRTPSTNQRRLA